MIGTRDEGASRKQSLRVNTKTPDAQPRPDKRPSLSRYHLPVFGIEAQGYCFGSGLPFCNSSIEMLSGERTKAIWPSRGGRLMTTPLFIRRSQVP